VLLVGAILAPGQRPVPPALRGMGQHQNPPFPHAPRVLNRAVWSRLTAAQIRLGLWRNAVARSGPPFLWAGWAHPTATRCSARGQRHGPRSSAFVPGAWRQSPWLTLAGGAVMGAAALGATGVGLAVLDRRVSVAALRRAARAGPADVDGSGAAEVVTGC